MTIKTIIFGVLLGSIFSGLLIAQVNESEKTEDYAQVDFYLNSLERYSRQRDQFFISSTSEGSQKHSLTQDLPRNPDDFFQDDPINKPIPYEPGQGLPVPVSSSRNGAATIVAMEVFFQTMDFFGVKASIREVNRRVEFNILESRSGYFQHLSKLDVAFAISEFARYLRAHMCGNANIENFYKAFLQVPPEEIGLRFKYDMAWALLGNPLPREPNSIFVLGQRWKSLGALFQGSEIIRDNSADAKEIKNWIIIISDVVDIVSGLNRLMCFVDIRPKPKEELRKRSVVKKLLNMQRDLFERYDRYETLINQAAAEGQQEQLQSLQQQAAP